MSATAILHIDASPLGELVRRLASVDVDRTEPLEAIGAAWESSTRGRFATGRDPDGNPWKPSQRALRKGGGKGTLVLTGRLRDSINYQVVGDDTVEVGTNVAYAAAHQFGSQRAGAHAVALHLPSDADPTAGLIILPARPFLGFSDDDYLNTSEILEGFVEARTAARGAP